MPVRFKFDVDTTYLRFDLNSPKFYDDICADIPAFAQYESDFVKTKEAKTRIFGWVVLMYDFNSPLRREIKDMYRRKVYAASICGITPNKLSGKYKDYVENILTGVDDGVNNLIVKYIASFASSEYKQLVFHATIQDQMLEKIVRGEADKQSQAMFDLAAEKVKSLTNLLYGTGERDEVYEARRALYKQVAYDLSDMRPESVAQTIAEEGKLPDEWSPYGEYIPDDIHFVGDDPNIARDDEEHLP